MQVHETDPIPLMEDILGTWPDVRVNIDCKSEAALAPLIDVIKKTNDPAYLPATIPANTYRGQTADVPAVAVRGDVRRRVVVRPAVPLSGHSCSPCVRSRSPSSGGRPRVGAEHGRG